MKTNVSESEITMTPETKAESELLGRCVADGIKVSKVEASSARQPIGFGSSRDVDAILVVSIKPKE